MRLSLRPSKTAMWRWLAADLREGCGRVGVDAASSAFKSYPLFRTCRYFGVDKSLAALLQGRRVHPEGIGLLSDLCRLDLPPASVDVCVSTYTLYRLPDGQRLVALRRLADIVHPDGLLIVELGNDGVFADELELLAHEFETAETFYFGNPLAQVYESWLERTGRVMPRSQQMGPNGRDRPRPARRRRGWRLLVLGSWLISLTEVRSPARSPRWNAYAYVRCTRRRGHRPDPLNLDDRRLIAEGVYDVEQHDEERSRSGHARRASLSPEPSSGG